MLRGQLRLDRAGVGCHKNLLGTHIRRCLAQSTLALPAARHGLGTGPLPEVHENVDRDAMQ